MNDLDELKQAHELAKIKDSYINISKKGKPYSNHKCDWSDDIESATINGVDIYNKYRNG